MEEIKVGDYVRYKSGLIRKISRIIPIYENDKLLKDKYYIEFDDKGDIATYRSEQVKEFIVKHSPNIIDLLEYGDLVKFKGWRTTKGIDVIDMRTNEKINLVFPDAEFCNGWTDNCMIYDLDYLIEKDQSNKIDWVLTHEQIKGNCYKV